MRLRVSTVHNTYTAAGGYWMDAIYVLYHRPRHVLYLCHQYATMLLAYGLSSAFIGSISGVIFFRRGEVRGAS